MRVWLVGVIVATATVAAADPGFKQIDLVSDQANVAKVQDPNLVNAWGLAAGPTTFWWVADNGTSVSTLYDEHGAPQPLIVDVHADGPTGLVFNGGDGFVVARAGHHGPARFIFASEAGRITGWSPDVPPVTEAVVEVRSRHAIYKGLAIATACHGHARLYATDFHDGRVDVFDDDWHELDAPGAFEDRRLPDGYAPFGIAVFGERVFVTYAVQDADRHDDVAGPGHGIIDEYDLDGRFIHRVASHGALNSPWGLAIGPESFGRFDDDLLVGNFGDGTIHAWRRGPFGHFFFDGTLRDPHGAPIVIDGLWSIAPGMGNDRTGSRNELFFTAGPDGESHGLFGKLVRAHW